VATIQRGVTPWVAEDGRTHSMRCAARVGGALDAAPPRRDYASEDLRRKLLEKGLRLQRLIAPLLDCAARRKNCSMTGATPRIFVAYSWPGRGGQGPLPRTSRFAPAHGFGGAFWSRNVLDALSGGGFVHLRESPGKRSLARKPPSTYADKQRQARFLGYRGFTEARSDNGTALGLCVDL